MSDSDTVGHSFTCCYIEQRLERAKPCAVNLLPYSVSLGYPAKAAQHERWHVQEAVQAAQKDLEQNRRSYARNEMGRADYMEVVAHNLKVVRPPPFTTSVPACPEWTHADSRMTCHTGCWASAKLQGCG